MGLGRSSGRLSGVREELWQALIPGHVEGQQVGDCRPLPGGEEEVELEVTSTRWVTVQCPVVQWFSGSVVQCLVLSVQCLPEVRAQHLSGNGTLRVPESLK